MSADRVETVEVHDVRFPTAAAGDGSDAINLVRLLGDVRRGPRHATVRRAPG